jgi:hypothetical protein
MCCRDKSIALPSLERSFLRDLDLLSGRCDCQDRRIDNMRQRWTFFLAILVILTWRSGVRAASEPISPAPQIDVFTMGPGDDLFSRFGHAAICVTDEDSPLGRCYNYGTADFSTPGPLTWGVLRGHGQFWVSVVSLPRMLLLYRLEDRTVYRQRLPLSPVQAASLSQRLHQADRPELTLYNYRHFDDNCTTRIRDLIDAVTEGALRRDNGIANQPPLRARVYDGFAAAPLLKTLSQLVLGRRVDAPIGSWESMFLPDVLRAELASHLHAPPEVVLSRVGPLPPSSSLPPILLWSLGGLSLLGLQLGGGRVGRGLVVALLLLLALVPWSLLIVARLPELRINEALLVMWPTDLLLLWPALRRRYVKVRLGGLLLVILGLLSGSLVQPLWGLLILVALPLVAGLRQEAGALATYTR